MSREQLYRCDRCNSVAVQPHEWRNLYVAEVPDQSGPDAVADGGVDLCDVCARTFFDGFLANVNLISVAVPNRSCLGPMEGRDVPTASREDLKQIMDNLAEAKAPLTDPCGTKGS